MKIAHALVEVIAIRSLDIVYAIKAIGVKIAANHVLKAITGKIVSVRAVAAH